MVSLQKTSAVLAANSGGLAAGIMVPGGKADDIPSPEVMSPEL